MNLNENLDFLDIITMIAFLMAIQTNEEMSKLLDYVNLHDQKLEKVLKKQEEILNELERERNA